MKDHPVDPSRRRWLEASCALAGSFTALASPRALAAESSPIKLDPLLAASEEEPHHLPEPIPFSQRTGFAVVGLGHLALEQVLPAFGESRLCRPAALVSGNRAKALAVAQQYGLDAKAVYDYASYDRLADQRDVAAVYIALPNSLHAEYTVRAAAAGKHVLCEKPMATSVADGQRMLDACAKAKKKLMIAYRMQYEPFNREVIRMARAGELGALRSFTAINAQAQGDPAQWRLKKSLAGGGPLPDVGIYCLNAARYLSGEEPNQVSAEWVLSPRDPRFREVEEQVDFVLRFPSGFLATASTSYALHDSKRYRLGGTTGWADLDPAFPYQGQVLQVGRVGANKKAQVERRRITPKNHFALELDHFARCLRDDKTPHTPGEEGLQDMRIIAAIYEAAEHGHRVTLPTIDKKDAFRGPPPADVA